MTGYVYVMGACFSCKKLMSFHPNHVPSMRIEGTREPFCRDCIERANPERIKNGLDAITIHPKAYEAAPENEVNWND